MARIVLRERLTLARLTALALCGGGLVILIGPLIPSGNPQSLLFALVSATLWAAGTVYLKWARIDASPLAIATAQLAIGTACIFACSLVFEGWPRLWPLTIPTVLALGYNGLIGLGLAYLLWFEVVTRLPATTASLGVLIVPVVGTAFSALMLGDRPSFTDLLGFALIFAAATIVLLPRGLPQRRRDH